MSKVTFRVDYSQSFRAGKSCPLPPEVTIDVDPAALSQEDRDCLAHRLDDKGVVRDMGETEDGGYYSRAITANGPAIDDLLTAVHAQDDRKQTYAAREAAAKANRQAENLAESIAALANPHAQDKTIYVRLMPDGDFSFSDYDSHPSEVVGQRPAKYHMIWQRYLADNDVKASPGAVEQRTRLDAATEASKDAAITAAKAELLRDIWQPRLDWIAAHGSAKLKRLVAEGIGHARTYAAERAKRQDRTPRQESSDRPLRRAHETRRRRITPTGARPLEGP